MTEPDAKRGANRLIHESSPYLLQHAHNPVDWYPWGPEALERARREDRPILLSIGYAACHWCHVMERESFEDPETATVMNRDFVCVKVDREERPDLDAIYMEAVQAMTGSGGWPMTVFLTPEGSPFYAGTYFPKEDRHGLPGFTRVLAALADVWRNQRDRAAEQGRRVVEALSHQPAARGSGDPLSEEILRGAHATLHGAFDPSWGGFGGAPKFPQPMALEFLLRCHLRGYPGSLEMVERSLDAMANGGMYDQVGGGFHRYSTDGQWHVPHFEKMLYDNAQLARVYLRAWQVTGREDFQRVATETLDYLLREMRHPDGAFCSSQDADSEGVEGKFFVWSWDELVEAAGEATGHGRAAHAVAQYLSATKEGNWEGTNVLWTPRRMGDVAASTGLTSGELLALVRMARPHLLERRERRVRPGTDDKVLAAWNGLAVATFAEGGRALGEPRYVEAARDALRFVYRHLVKDGRLHRSWRDGRLGGPGYADDHALVGLGALALYETTFDERIFRWLRSLVQDMLRLFGDPAGGGFFQTGTDAEELVVRPRDLFDNAAPSGNSAAVELLLRMSLLTGREDWEEGGVAALRAVRDLMERAPSGFGHALCALDLYLSSPKEVAIAGDPASPDARALLDEIHGRFRPNVVVAAGSEGHDGGGPELLRDRPTMNGKATAYVCERFVCKRPVTEPGELAAQLGA